jgi:SNF2 family DNA or RNA helicase
MIMTGTPIAKNVMDLFSQFKFLNGNILGHRYLTTFRNEYCHVRQTDFGPLITGYKNLEKLYERIDPHIFRITSEEALDLPPKVYVTRQFSLSDQQKKLMKELKEQFFIQAKEKDFSSVSNAAGLLTKLQQISCGYLPMDEGEPMELPNPRMDELQNILDQREGKAIIWCRFNRDIEKVIIQLRPLAVHYYGKTTQVERERHKAMFLDPASPIRYLVASPEAAGTGLNLQGSCNTNIYYSNSFNSLARWQSEGRTWRDGTVGTVTYFDLIANRSPDAKILKNLQDKKSISDLTLDEYRKIFDFLSENE